MPSMQTTYADTMAVAVAGMLANTGPTAEVSRQVETAAIGFGVAVKQGAADKGILAATAAADVFVGITLRDQSTRPSATPDVNAVADDALVLKRGVVWVVAGAAVPAAGVAAYMVVGTAQAGRFTPVSTSNLPIVRGTFDTTCAAAGDLVQLRLS